MAELRSVNVLEGELESTKSAVSEPNVNKAFYQLHPEYGLIGLNGSPFLEPRMPQNSVNPETLKTVTGNIPGTADINTPKELSLTKPVIIKNLIVISFAFLILFTAFHSNAHLHHNLSDNHDLGTASLSVVYGAMIVSCILMPHLLISLFGLKLTLMLSILTYAIYFSANFDLSFQAVIPSSLVLGLGGGGLWVANCIYITEFGTIYARLSVKEDDGYESILGLTESMISKFFAIFFMVFQTGQVWGNMIAHGLFTHSQPQKGNSSSIVCETTFFSCTKPKPTNITEYVDIVREVVGNVTSLRKNTIFETQTEWIHPLNLGHHPIDVHHSNPRYLEYLFPGVYTAAAVFTVVLVWIWLEPIGSKYEYYNFSRSSLQEMIMRNKTIAQLRHPYQLLLIPITVFSGLEQAFIITDFAKALHKDSCFNVSYILISFGASNAFFCTILACVAKRISRISKLGLGASFSVAAIATLFITENYINSLVDSRCLYYFVAALWGASDAVWQSQINSLYGILFVEEERVAAFSNYRLWESVGFLIAYSYSYIDLCLKTKIISLITVLFLGFISYLGIELHMVKPDETDRVNNHQRY